MADRVLRRAQPLMLVSPVRTGDWQQRILAFEALREVQQLPYFPEPSKKDCYQPVAYSAVNGGECKALTTTLVALLRRLGMTARVEWIMQPGKPLNHVSSLVWIDGQWMWCDASIRGAVLGESPYHALQRTGAYHVVGGQPVEPAGAPAPSPRPGPSGGSRFRNRFPFNWFGWPSIWGGWPAWWWEAYYPYLYTVDYYPAYYPSCFSYAGVTYCPVAGR